MPRRILVAALAAALLAGCAEYVDDAPAIAVADGLYRAIGKGYGPVRLGQFYAPEFAKQAPDWPTTLAKIEHAGGPVTSAKLQSSQMSAKDDGPCYLLDYQVTRPAGLMEETLYVCRDGEKGSPWHILGHGLRRPDTGQELYAGYKLVESGVCVGSNCPAK